MHSKQPCCVCNDKYALHRRLLDSIGYSACLFTGEPWPITFMSLPPRTA